MYDTFDIDNGNNLVINDERSYIISTVCIYQFYLITLDLLGSVFFVIAYFCVPVVMIDKLYKYVM